MNDVDEMVDEVDADALRAEIEALKARLARYEALDAATPILDAASVAEFAGLARTLAASHERLRGQVARAEAEVRMVTGKAWAVGEETERATAERIALMLEASFDDVTRWTEEHRVASEWLFRAAVDVRAGKWKAGPPSPLYSEGDEPVVSGRCAKDDPAWQAMMALWGRQ